MKIDWDTVSTDLTGDQVASASEPVGRFILVHTQFELLLGRLIAACSGLADNQTAVHLVQALDSVSKRRIIDAVSSIYGSDPNGVVPNFRPQPELRKRLKALTMAFEAASKVRNTLAHGTLGRIHDRVFIGSIAATSFFKNTAGAENWIFIDAIDKAILAMFSAMDDGVILQKEFADLHRDILKDGAS